MSPDFLNPGSGVDYFPDQDSHPRNLSIFIPGSRILDPGSGFIKSRIRFLDPGAKKTSTGSRTPESGSATRFIHEDFIGLCLSLILERQYY
jgi:hypothetical protein